MRAGFRRKTTRPRALDNDWLRLTGDDQHTSRVFDGSVAMRRFLLAAMMFGTAAGAQAADMPDFLHGSLLPSGPSPTVNWQGFYVGGQGAVGESDMNFTGATQSVAAKLLVDTAEEQAASVSSWPLGGKISTSRHRLWRLRRLQQPMGQRRFRPRVQLPAWQLRRHAIRQHVSPVRRRPGYHRPGDICVQRLDRDFRHGNVSRPRRLCGRIVPALYVRRGSAGTGRYRQDRHDLRDSGPVCPSHPLPRRLDNTAT